MLSILLAMVPCTMELTSGLQKQSTVVCFREPICAFSLSSQLQSSFSIRLRGGEQKESSAGSPRKRKNSDLKKTSPKSFRKRSRKWKRKKKVDATTEKVEEVKDDMEESSVHVYNKESDLTADGLQSQAGAELMLGGGVNTAGSFLTVRSRNFAQQPSRFDDIRVQQMPAGANASDGGEEIDDSEAGFDGMFERTPLARNDTAGMLKLLREMDRECDAVQPLIETMGRIIAMLPPKEEHPTVSTA
jgi:hypothetical protein